MQMFYKKAVIKRFMENSQEKTCNEVWFLVKLQTWAPNFTKTGTQLQVFSILWDNFSEQLPYRAPVELLLL